MKNARYMFAAIVLILVSPAYGDFVPDLKNGQYAGQYTYQVAANSRDVYAMIVRHAQKCYRVSQEKIKSDLDLSNGKGRVAVVAGFGNGRMALISIDVQPKGKRTQVDVYYGLKNWNTSASAVKGWVDGSSSRCFGTA